MSHHGHSVIGKEQLQGVEAGEDQYGKHMKEEEQEGKITQGSATFAQSTMREETHRTRAIALSCRPRGTLQLDKCSIQGCCLQIPQEAQMESASGRVVRM